MIIVHEEIKLAQSLVVKIVWYFRNCFALSIGPYSPSTFIWMCPTNKVAWLTSLTLGSLFSINMYIKTMFMFLFWPLQLSVHTVSVSLSLSFIFSFAHIYRHEAISLPSLPPKVSFQIIHQVFFFPASLIV